MASPQKENGYTATAHELVEAFCGLQVSGGAHRILRFIERKTYGYNKKWDKISLSQFELMTTLDRRTITRALEELENANIIKINRDGITNSYSINKDYETWVGVKTPLGAKMTAARGENAHETRGENAIYKRKKAITKDISDKSQKDMGWKTYNENKHSDDTPSIDLDSREEFKTDEDTQKEQNAKVTELIEWGAKLRKKPFMNIPTQRKKIQELKSNGISPALIKSTFIELLHSEYWQKSDMLPDFKTVHSTLANKK
jgi:phage replication O-like protein O